MRTHTAELTKDERTALYLIENTIVDDTAELGLVEAAKASA